MGESEVSISEEFWEIPVFIEVLGLQKTIFVSIVNETYRVKETLN